MDDEFTLETQTARLRTHYSGLYRATSYLNSTEMVDLTSKVRLLNGAPKEYRASGMENSPRVPQPAITAEFHDVDATFEQLPGKRRGRAPPSKLRLQSGWFHDSGRCPSDGGCLDEFLWIGFRPERAQQQPGRGSRPAACRTRWGRIWRKHQRWRGWAFRRWDLVGLGSVAFGRGR
jgi:hypothetical protein